MKNILIPTDFSKNALCALQYAQELHKSEPACFFLLHTYAEEVHKEYRTATSKKIEKVKTKKKEQSEEKLTQLLHTVTEHLPNPLHHFETIARLDSLVDGVNDFVDEKNIDLVVMSTKGETSDHKTTFGSYTLEVFKYVTCPVLVIPEDCGYKLPKTILFPTDYRIPYNQRELNLLGDLAAHFKAELHCLYFTEFDKLSQKQEDNKLLLREALSQISLFFETKPSKNKAQAIMEYIQENNVDLLTMINPRYSFFDDLLQRSTVDTLGLKVKIPFLVMQNLYR